MNINNGKNNSRFFFLIIFFSLLISSLQFAQSAESILGNWVGTLSLPGAKLRIVLKISLNENNQLRTLLDSPDQGATDIPADSTFYSGTVLRVVLTALRGEYAGEYLSSVDSIRGKWTQVGQSFPLDLGRTDVVPTQNRPQEPKGPFPYYSEDVTFSNSDAGVTLAGTLTLPDTLTQHPVVVLISGSGAQNRDEELFGHKPFFVIADFLTRLGIGVLRFDDRGVAKSTGSFSEATTEDFASDVQAAVKYLRSRKDIQKSKIGLMGHSEGGIIAPMVAAADPAIAFIVLLAGPAITGEEIIYQQQDLIYEANGVAPELRKKAIDFNKVIFTLLKEQTDTAKLRSLGESEFKKWGASLTEDEKNNLGVTDADFEREMPMLSLPWFRFFLMYDPAPTLRRVKCPVLALNGEKDLQVPAATNLPVIEQIFKEAGNTRSKIVLLPGLNHLFQMCQSGAPSEYAAIEETFNEEVLKIISEWIQSVLK